MFFGDFCGHLYFWPYLAYVASLKGICPIPDYFPIVTPPTPTTVPTEQTSIIITFEPTTPTIATTTTTIPVCPIFALICNPTGVSPITNCPCIDPRQRLPIKNANGDIIIFHSFNPRQRRRRNTRLFAQKCVDLNNRPGKCVTAAACPEIVRKFYERAQKFHDLDFRKFIGNFMCGFDGLKLLICCPMERSPPSSQGDLWFQPLLNTSFQFAPLNNKIDITTPSPFLSWLQLQTSSSPPTFSSLFSSESYKPVTNQGDYFANPYKHQWVGCGISNGLTNRVVGGLEAKKGAYPWMAALAYSENQNPNVISFLCGGSLIASNFVLTSAHCISPELILVRLGAHDLSVGKELNSLDFRIKRTIVHGNFDAKTVTNDIALIELNSFAPFNENICPICLPEDETFFAQDFVGTHPFVAGWGSVHHMGPGSNVLRDTQVPIVDRQLCEENFRRIFNFIKFSANLICAGDAKNDACQGDSGGPLMMPKLEGSLYRYYIIGIVSYGFECARPGFPGVYTRVPNYINWIKTHMN